MKLILIDNYDSFTHILQHYFESIDGVDLRVMRNDAIDYELLNNCRGIILSPGPGLPKEAGQLMQVITKYYNIKPMLGVCLGHQAISEFFGASLINLKQVVHGEAHEIFIESNTKLFNNIPNNIKVARYHSWIVDYKTLPYTLRATSFTIDKELMSFEHEKLPIAAVQFHPESILSQYGLAIVNNFITHFCK